MTTVSYTHLNDDRQTVFLAKPVGGAADIVITPLVGMVEMCIRDSVVPVLNAKNSALR